MWRVLVETWEAFQKDECPRLAASLAYYTLFYLPALVLAIVLLAGIFVGGPVAQRQLTTHVGETMSPTVAEQIGALAQRANRSEAGLGSWLLGLAVLLVGATGALVEVQTALNRACRVEPDPRQGGWMAFFVKRLVSLGMLLAIALLLLASLVVSWLLTAFSEWIDGYAPSRLTSWAVTMTDHLVSLAVVTLLIAAILKFVPDAELAWSDVWAGAIVTSLLFVLGKAGMGLYLAYADPTTAFGAAGSLALVLLWIYYSALALFFGAELAQVLTRRRGKRVAPERGALPTA